jgi:hypothetical protein
MSVYTVSELRQKLAEDKQDDTIIAVIWQRRNFPAVWDRIISAFTDDDWNDDLVNATGDALGIDLAMENPGFDRSGFRVYIVREKD